MIRQRSLCTIKLQEGHRQQLLRNASAKNIKMRERSKCREASPQVTSHKGETMKTALIRSLPTTHRENQRQKQQRGENKGENQSKWLHPGQQQKKQSLRNSPINIKKDLKNLILRNTQITSKKKQPPQQNIAQKSKASKVSEQKKVIKEVMSRKNSVCNLKIIKEEKYSKPKINKNNNKSSHNSKDSSIDPCKKQKSTNKKTEITSVQFSARPILSQDDMPKIVSRDLYAQFTDFKSGNTSSYLQNPQQKQNFLEFFKQYRKSFDLRGVKVEYKHKTGRFLTAESEEHAYK